MDTLKLNIENSTGEIIIRDGKAPDPLPVREPKIISIAGDIHSVSNFIKDRAMGHGSQEIDMNKAIVTVDKNKRTILLQLDPENYYGASILAQLEQSDELKKFGINTTQRYSRKHLLDLIRFNRVIL